jgi:hypothetical protein
MTESNARVLLSIMGVSAVIGYILAITLGLQGYQPVALALFIASLADSIATFFVYRYYTRLRGARWQDELKAGEEQMKQMLSEGSENVKRDA